MTKRTEDVYIIRVKKFVSKFWSVSEDKLDRQTKLEDDLGITRDDSIESFDLFPSKFEVDLTELNLKKYFENEGVGLINFSWIFGKRKTDKRSLHEITLADLENTLTNGKWVEPQ